MWQQLWYLRFPGKLEKNGSCYKLTAVGQLFKQKFPFLRGKKIGQKIYSTFAVHGEYKFQDGDGDVFFI